MIFYKAFLYVSCSFHRILILQGWQLNLRLTPYGMLQQESEFSNPAINIWSWKHLNSLKDSDPIIILKYCLCY